MPKFLCLTDSMPALFETGILVYNNKTYAMCDLV